MPDYITAKKYATLVVAASDSTATGKSTADYVCDGISDQVEINNAINALPSQGGKVILLEGTYTVDASVTLPSNVALEGQGISNTKIKIKNSLNADINVITNSDQVSGNTNIVVLLLSVDGNKANNSAGIQRGIYFVKVTSSIITETKSFDCRSQAINLSESTGNLISGCIAMTSDECISLVVSSNYNSVIGNLVKDSTTQGILLNASSYNTISGNVCQNNPTDNIRVRASSNENIITGNICQGGATNGIVIWSSANYNTISGNSVQGAGWHGIFLKYASHNTVNANFCIENSQAAHNTYSNIIVSGDGANYSTYNNIQGNTCRQGALANKPQYGIRIDASNNYNIVRNNDLYDSGATGKLLDSATGTGTGVEAATWHKDITKSSIGTAFVNVYTGANGEAQQVDFTGYSMYRLIVHVNKVGTGTQSWRLEDAGNSANGLQLDDAAAAAEHELDSGWVALPAFAIGTVKLIPKGKSTVAGDSPVFRRAVLLLK